MIGAALQALIALAALWRAGDDHAVARLHALHHRPHFLHHAHAGVIQDGGVRVVVGAQRVGRDRIACNRGFSADQNLARLDRQQLQLLYRNACAVSHPCPEFSA